jgi:hypothetical protein
MDKHYLILGMRKKSPWLHPGRLPAIVHIEIALIVASITVTGHICMLCKALYIS